MVAGEIVSLKITDATMTPVEHAEKLYKRAAKQRRAVEKLQPLIQETEKLLLYVEEVQESVALLERCVILFVYACIADFAVWTAVYRMHSSM